MYWDVYCRQSSHPCGAFGNLTECKRHNNPTSHAHLEVPALGLQPVVDEALGVPGEAQHELPLGLQLVYSLDGLVDLRRERGGRGYSVNSCRRFNSTVTRDYGHHHVREKC